MATISSTIELVDRMSSTLADIETNVNSMKQTLQSVSDQQSSIDGFSWNTFISNAEAAASKIQSIGAKMSAGLTAPLVVLGKKMYSDAVEYESAFTGVRKTTDATEEQFQQLYDDLINISETTPTGFIEAAGIMEMAGQLGVGKVNEVGEDISAQYRVATEDLTKFTETYIALQAATNIGGEEGAADLARFLNVTEKTTANVDKVGGVIVALGNNFATTENEILSMATRMGATADLAGFSSAEILAFSAALSSVGINAEAGGSAAGKLMKRMQLAAEVGGTAQEKLSAAGYDYESGLDFVNALSVMKKADIVDIADSLGMTVDAVQDLGDSWLALDQFASVMGLDSAGFLKSWDSGAATSMLKFFQGLGNLDETTGNSVLAQLAEMDITEIRLSNLVAAMAGNSDLFAAALATAYEQYGLDYENNALYEEFAKRLDTQEAQNQMLSNKLDNTMADFGQNLVDALQPALDIANQILDAFNQLSESDQTAIIEALGAIALLGPGLTIVGTAMKGIASAMKLIHSFGDGASKAVSSAADVATGASAATSWLTGVKNWLTEKVSGIDLTGVWNGAFVADWFTHNTDVGRAITGQETWSDVGDAFEDWQRSVEQNVQNFGSDWSNLWKQITGQPITETPTVSVEPEVEIPEDVASEIQAQIDSINRNDPTMKLKIQTTPIVQPETATWGAAPEGLFDTPEINVPEAVVNVPEVNVPETIVNTPEVNIPQTTIDVPETTVDVPEITANIPEVNIPETTVDVPVMVQTVVQTEMTFEEIQADLERRFGTSDPIKLQMMIEAGQIDLTELQNSTLIPETTIDVPVTPEIEIPGNVSGMLQSSGADMANGLAIGISGSNAPFEAADAMGANTVNAANAALGVASPSTFMIQAGTYFDQGLMIGIQAGQGMVIAAVSAVGNRSVATARGILSSGAGSSIGLNFAQGLANGIRAGQGAVVSAAASLASAALAAAKGLLGIHSPSTETYWQGEMMIAGYVNALSDGADSVNRTVGKIIEGTESSWNQGVWSTISALANLEQKMWEDDMNNVEDAFTMSDSDISKIRNLAEREVVNHVTSPTFQIEFNPTVHASSEVDLDGIITYLEDHVAERLESCSEGVYQ